MPKYEVSRWTNLINRLNRALARAKRDRLKMKELINKAETMLTNHAQSLSDLETDVDNLKARVAILEGGV